MSQPTKSFFRGAASVRSGFTLVEILVVVCIIAVLAGLSLVGVTKALAAGKQTKCLSNLRQISVALLVYASENDNFLPRATIKAGTPDGDALGLTGDYMWSKQLGPYLPQQGKNLTSKAHMLFICPCAKYTGYGSNPSSLSLTYNCTSTFYGMNTFSSAASNGNAQDGPGRSLAAIENPSQTLLVTEGKQSGTSASCQSSARWTDQASPDLRKTKPEECVYLDFRHGGKINVIYADGHVGKIDFNDRGTITRAMWEGRNY